MVRYPFDTATLSRPAGPRDRLALLVHPVVHTVTSLRHHHPLLRRVALRCGLLQLDTQFGVWLTWRMISGVGSFLSCAMQPRGTWSIMSPRSSTHCRRERFKSTADAAGAGASRTRCFFTPSSTQRTAGDVKIVRSTGLRSLRRSRRSSSGAVIGVLDRATSASDIM